MAVTDPLPRCVVHFDRFEVDIGTGELRRDGFKVKVQDKPFRILAELLLHPGELVTRDQLQRVLWSSGTFVDFEESLDAAIYRLRRALDDSSEHPKYIETLARRGYRFVGHLEEEIALNAEAAPGKGLRARGAGASDNLAPPGGLTTTVFPENAQPRPRRRLVRTLVAAGMFSVLALLLWWLHDSAGFRGQPTGEKEIASGAIRSLVVLPLQNLSGDSSQQYFADGITEALTTDLGRIGELRVISRTSASHYKGGSETLPQIAQELGVDAVVEGGVARFGNRVRVTAQLIQARSDRHLWSRSYEGDARDTLGLEDKVARDIAEEVQVRVWPQQQRRPALSRPLDLAVEEEYFRGRYELNTWTEAGLKGSIGHFITVSETDPGYAPGWAGLAAAYSLLGLFGYAPRHAALVQARAAAQRALALDPSLPEAHVFLASSTWPLEWSALVSPNRARQAYADAERELRLAIALNPNDAIAHQWLGYHLAASGRLDDAIAEMERARELDPISPSTQNSLGAVYYWAGRDDEALAQFREVPDPDANSERRHQRMALIYERKGMLQSALAELLASLRLAHKQPLAASVERAYRSGGYSAARRVYLRGDIRDRERLAAVGHPLGALEIAADYALLGNTRFSLRWLRTAVHQRDLSVIYIKIDDRFQSLHSEPRFRNLLVQLGLPP